MNSVKADWIGGLHSKSLPVACKAGEDLAAYDLLRVTGMTGQAFNVSRATSATMIGSATKLLIAPLAVVNGGAFLAYEWMVITADTSARTLGDRVYVTTAGDYTYTSSSNATPVGQVITVSTTGKILLAPGAYPPAMGVATHTVTSTAAPTDISFPFTVAASTKFLVDIRTSTGTKRGEGTDTFTVNGGNLRVTYGAGAAPDIQVNDVITVIAFPTN